MAGPIPSPLPAGWRVVLVRPKSPSAGLVEPYDATRLCWSGPGLTEEHAGEARPEEFARVEGV